MIPNFLRCAFYGLASAALVAAPTLPEAFAGKFRIGVAIRDPQAEERSPATARLLREQFNSITAENLLKWGPIHPKRDTFVFEPADRYVAFGEQRGMKIIGHTLVWHQQTPAWVFQADDGSKVSRTALLERMREHIHTVVGRYRGRIHGWDVVNEALAEDGGMRRSPWFEIIGEEFVARAFAFAREADPDAELYYNEYGMENPAKRRGALALIRKLQAQGLKVTGVGIQGHYGLQTPATAQVEATIRDLAALGVKVMITELDVNVLPDPQGEAGADLNVRYAADPRWNPYVQGLPDEVQGQLARRYAGLFEIFVRNAAVIDRVTFWNLHDGSSWLNNWPIRGRTNHPLLFDRAGQPKPAFAAVIAVARGASRPGDPAGVSGRK